MGNNYGPTHFGMQSNCFAKLVHAKAWGINQKDYYVKDMRNARSGSAFILVYSKATKKVLYQFFISQDGADLIIFYEAFSELRNAIRGLEMESTFSTGSAEDDDIIVVCSGYHPDVCVPVAMIFLLHNKNLKPTFKSFKGWPTKEATLARTIFTEILAG